VCRLKLVAGRSQGSPLRKNNFKNIAASAKVLWRTKTLSFIFFFASLATPWRGEQPENLKEFLSNDKFTESVACYIALAFLD